ncbi:MULTISPECIES: anaerobic sulfite reductase subunit AsrB [unclassified Fusibacter]|uniref:anaerobic sulfite reductase subunit AsrB n=1 Tax=unclassified Fusibacter TaxID=2624464 RepID=UPI001010705F|nr:MULTISPECIES: anaerobic sulfite reductase subunit AsrB [unclassified Fusibacter]MCK8060503.1 anaerobic sulfite reductase subunit AsrB [Fusibacter sp. A2]NPE20208.1 anaerobic sulfite reductase subunit AsrB [Fusibacter sp. A1]RXV63417.1 anaerobic sulfite reductase subunit AsrB [Fusibacter sp. A1]
MKNEYLAFPFEILSIVKETEIDWTYTVKYDGPLVGGQFMQLSIPGVGEAPISISDFRDGSLDMTIRKVGRLTDAIFNLEAGDSLFMRGPYGNGFELSKYVDKHVVIIAGGTGLAPVKNVIEKLTSGEIKTNSTRALIGFKSPDDVLFEDALKRWSQDHEVTVTVDKQPDKPWNGKVGLVTEHIPTLEGYDIEKTEAIVVGPPMMMKFTTLALLKAGYLPQNITVSFERNMSCGIGKCGHCKIDETYVCLEGPVFNYTTAVKLLD